MSTSILTTSSIFAKFYEDSKLQGKIVPRFSLFAPSRFRKRKVHIYLNVSVTLRPHADSPN